MLAEVYDKWLILGNFIHSQSIDEVEILEDWLMIIVNGTIKVSIKRPSVDKIDNLKTEYSVEENQVIKLKDDEFIIPGFIDCHTHASQFTNLGIGCNLPLLEWLNKYTFPTEMELGNPEFATKVYTDCVQQYLSNGTTCASYFATIHLESTKILADVMLSLGQRGYVGKVNMDCNAPSQLSETTTQSLKDTLSFINHFKQPKFQDFSVMPIITPRFVVTSTSDLLGGLGELSKQHNLMIQSHLSENLNEIEAVKQMFPKNKNYCDVYCSHNLLNKNTLMAHCIHLSDEELIMMKENGAKVVHCPSSNFNLKSGVLDIKRVIKYGIEVGLGTDISAGSSLSMLHSMRKSIIASEFYSSEVNPPLNEKQAFYLATLGGAKVLNLDLKIGNFKVGKKFDANLVKVNSYTSLTLPEKLFKLILCGDDRSITKVFVDGKVVICK